MMKRWMLFITLSLALAACGDADSKAKGKVVGGTGGGGTPSSNSDFSTDDGEFSGAAEQAIFGSGVISDAGASYHVTLLVMNDTVDVCPLVPRSCEGGIPDIGEAQMSAILIGPETLPVGEFTIHSQVPDSLIAEGGLVAQVGIIGYDQDGTRSREDALAGDVVLSTLTERDARGRVSAVFTEGTVNIEFDADQCEALSWFIEQCL